MRRFLVVLAVYFMSLVAAVALAAPASAAPPGATVNGRVCTKEGSCAEVYNHSMIVVCDRHKDGHRVRAWYFHQMRPYTEPNPTGWAPSGGCHREGATWGYRIERFRVCIEVEGCTNYVRTNQ